MKLKRIFAFVIIFTLIISSLNFIFIKDYTFAETTQKPVTENIGATEDTEEASRPKSGQCGENVTWKLSSKGTLTISGKGAMTNYKYDSVGEIVYVPNTEFPDDKTEIAPFFDYDDIKKVVIKKGVTSIGKYAFYGCDGISKITFPSSGFKKIGSSAFRKCTAISEVTVPKTVTSCGSNAFRGCEGLKKVTFNGKIKTLNSYTFRECSALEEITLPSTLTTIGSYAFYKCRKLVNINIPDKVKKINKYAFYQCDSLETIVLPEVLTTIGNYTFSGCGKLKNITLPQSLTSLGKNAFANNASLEEIAIPEGITEIQKYTFNNCTSLKRIVIPSSITSIGNYAFRLCAELQEVTFPANLQSIGSYAFMNCKGLKEINIPESVTEINAYAFYCCSNLITVKLPSAITAITQYTFCGCTSLTDIVIPENVTHIGSRAFAECTAIKELKIPDSVTEIGKNAFEYFTGKILCGRNTAAESHAIENGLEYFIPVNENHSHEFLDRKIIREPSCTEKGSKYVYCSGCGYEEIQDIPETEHSPVKDVIPATSAEDGMMMVFCSKCGNIIEECTIYKANKITLGNTERVYNGKTFKPILNIKNSKNVKLAKGTDYTVKIVNHAGKVVQAPKNVGNYRYIISFKGNYSGKVTKKFTIKPKSTNISTIKSNAKKQTTVIWNKRTAQVNGYQIRYSTSQKFKTGTVKTVTVSKNSVTKKIIKNLKSGKRYYMQVRTFKAVNGSRIFSAWSNSKSVKVR